MSLRIVSCGPGVTVQDLGRIGHRRHGISTAGAMDRLSLARANALVGNTPDEAAIEVTLATLTIEVTDAPICLGWAGPGFGATLDGAARPDHAACHLQPGQRLTLGPVRAGVFGYVAVAGGLDIDAQFGSRSVHQRTGIGGAPLGPGDVIPCRGNTPLPPLRFLRVPPRRSAPIRLLPGPQADLFAPDAMPTLLQQSFTIGRVFDRMGYRLDGPALAHRVPAGIVSDGVLPGTLQVTSDGRAIVLMRDCQTTGGYPKLATIITADLDRFAQHRAGDPVLFALATRAAAIKAARDVEAEIRAVPSTLQGIADWRDSGWLLSQNLIGGVHCAPGDDPPSFGP